MLNNTENHNNTDTSKAFVCYKVNYVSGLPNEPRPIYKLVLNLLPTGFLINSNRKYYFNPLYIPYNQVEEFEITKGSGTFMGSNQLHNMSNANQILIIFKQNDIGTTMILEMAEHIMFPAQNNAMRCQDLLNIMKQKDIFNQFRTDVTDQSQNLFNINSATQNDNDTNDIILLIEQLSNLHKSGILTDEEFEDKKKILLGKLNNIYSQEFKLLAIFIARF